MAGERGIYVFGVEVAEPARRQGVARAAFLALEEIARQRAHSFISLHVFGHNHGARRLYETLGYQPTSITMRKDV